MRVPKRNAVLCRDGAAFTVGHASAGPGGGLYVVVQDPRDPAIETAWIGPYQVWTVQDGRTTHFEHVPAFKARGYVRAHGGVEATDSYALAALQAAAAWENGGGAIAPPLPRTPRLVGSLPCLLLGKPGWTEAEQPAAVQEE